MTVELHLGDCLEVMAELPENSVDTVLTDPPYGLTFMGKDWDRGVPGVAFWREALRVAKPGAMLLAMGGTRTFHRLVVAIEDAGFEVRDTIAWVYGSGFPKSYDISKGIEAQMKTGRSSPKGQRMVAMGDEYEQTPLAGTPNYGVTGNFTNKDTGSKPMAITTPEAQLWHGWGTALKPAMELICVAMKPIDGTYVNNALTWGVAGLNIDGGRVEGEYKWRASDSTIEGQIFKAGSFGDKPHRLGRFPANFVHDGSDEVVGLFPQGGNNNGYTPANTEKSNASGKVYGFANYPDMHKSGAHYGDSGSAARFFYCAKASRSERNAGLEGMEEVDATDMTGRKDGSAGLLRVRADGSIGENPYAGKSANAKNHHPTVKPLALMRYLARLTKTPTGGVVLDPFMGSGTTGMAAVLEGRDFIGIELNAEYLEIAERRIAEAQMQQGLFVA